MMTKNARTIAQQQELIHKLGWNENMGCHTKLGFEHVVWPEKKGDVRYFIFFDVDGVHALNEKHGSYAVFDAMIKQVLSTVRSTDAIAGQVNSGDEFLVCLIETPDRAAPKPEAVVERLTAELAKHGLTAIFAVREVKSPSLWENVKPAIEEVLAAKKARGQAQ